MENMPDFKEVEQLLTSQNCSEETISQFGELYQHYFAHQKDLPEWEEITSPSIENIIEYDTLEPVDTDQGKRLLSKLAVCRLNGGLGTSMGCVGPKSAIEVRNEQSFLDLIVTQIRSINAKYSANVPLLLMNSFNSDQDTKKIIRKYSGKLAIHTFIQSEFPRLRRDSFMPLSSEKYGEKASYPPGHGDFYMALDRSGLLDQLIDQGKEYMFIANADNLGGAIDLSILKLMVDNKAPFIMEVTDKTRADVKGGTLVKTNQNELRLLEIAQVPQDRLEEFKSVKKFKIFNTNNVWINLIELRKKLRSNTLKLDVMINHKYIDHLPVVQLETAIGGGINSFEGSLAVKVPRSRFLPVKKTDDLLLVQSNLFILKDGVLVRNPERQFDGLPLIRLGESFQTVEAYNERFKTIPDILELDILTVVGDVYFGKDIRLCGNVILVCERDELHLPDRSNLENRVLTGSIRMGML